MPTKITYRMTQTDDGYVAKCEELSVEALGRSPAQALAALRKEVEQRLASVDAVAPPSRPPPPPSLELIPVAPEANDADPEGPGDSPAAG